MRSEAEIELYAGNGAAAYDRLVRDERSLKKSLLLRLQYIRSFTAFARGRAAVASIQAAPELRAERVAEARRLARALRREKMAYTKPLAAMVTASVANAEGNRAATLAALREAITAAENADMAMHAAAARHQLGLVLGDSGGVALVSEAEDAMRAQEVRLPARFASMLLPGRWGTSNGSL
jgi:ATP/maltotriose-dependent transcriptional regulator MalT